MSRPAILDGGERAPVVPISQPTLPDLAAYQRGLEEIFRSHQITNDRWVARLERDAARKLDVPEVVAVANATSGLILVAKLLGLRGRVLLPSFTFPATLHALLWNDLAPVLVDCDPETFNVDPGAVERALGTGPAAAVVPVYIFGNAPDWDRLTAVIERAGLRCFSDAAHALGTKLGTRSAGSFGDAEVFSLAPTKVTVAGEGGLIATRNADLARALRVARNYGNPGDYDCVVAGLNARQSELHALLACLSLEQLERNVARREELVGAYRAGLSGIPGLGFQRIAQECRSTHNYFAVRIDAAGFGLTNRELRQALDAEGIRSKIYFHPPLHRQTAFAHLPGLQGEFPNTDRVCATVLCLPLYTHMEDTTVARVIDAVSACHRHAEEVRAVIARGGGGTGNR